MNEVDLGAGAFCLLICAGALSGLVSLWAFRRWSDTTKLRAAANRIVAHLLELRLFGDEPALVLRAQRDLLLANGEFLRRAIFPCLLLFLPFSLLLIVLDAFCSRAPLQVGRAAIITLDCSPSATGRLPQVQLSAPSAIRVETAPVHVPASSEICWRVRPIGSVTGDLNVNANGRVIKKSISSAAGFQWLSDQRLGWVAGFLLHPLELPYFGSSVRSISVDYPPATVFKLNWMVWFSAASLLGAAIGGLPFHRRERG